MKMYTSHSGLPASSFLYFPLSERHIPQILDGKNMNNFWAGKTLMHICNNSALPGAARNKYLKNRESTKIP